ncbi:MAG TPA: VOC family protein [Tepidisphaeraceae bacterium]|jgi:catechol 2,3-dioxygenase-like lactoylglutathione lyase family enzyme|nr:VOC family protein [Tepidisphaeraceae bacterium]
MKITGTHHVALCTPNFEQTCKFYIETLGLKQVGSFSGRNIIFVDAGPTTIEIIERLEPMDRARQGWVHFAFEVPDIDAAYAELTGKGIAFHIEPKLFPEINPAVRLAFFKDPDGNELELVQPLASRYPNPI